jgi:glutathione S-transferase
MITLYHNNMSVCAQKVRVVLAEKNIAVQEHHLNIRAGETHAPDYLALNPKGVVPTLLVNGEPIVESSIICEYLEDAFPEHRLLPAEPAQRAAARQWTLRPDAGLHNACGTLSFATAFRFQNSAGQMAARKPGPVTSLLADLIAKGLDSAELPPRLVVWAELLDDMGAQLAHHAWLAGDRFSLADIAVLPYVVRLSDLRQEWLWKENPKRAAIGDWLERCRAQPGYRGIAGYLDQAYLDTMAKHGADAEPRLRALFSSVEAARA